MTASDARLRRRCLFLQGQYSNGRALACLFQRDGSYGRPRIMRLPSEVGFEAFARVQQVIGGHVREVIRAWVADQRKPRGK